MSSPAIPTPDLTCYRLVDQPMEIIPGRAAREWMDDTKHRRAYACIPLSMANASGWEIILPVSFTAEWNGGTHKQDLTIIMDEGCPLVSSHFGYGVVTFHTGWLFQTSPGWALWCRGAPNHLYDGIVPLEGVVESDWLAFSFTMNWRFTAPGAVRFEKGEAICFITLLPHAVLDGVTPRIRRIEDAPTLQAENKAWSRHRAEFNELFESNEPAAVQAAFQHTYARGGLGNGHPPPAFHRTKRKLPKPQPDVSV